MTPRLIGMTGHHDRTDWGTGVIGRLGGVGGEWRWRWRWRVSSGAGGSGEGISRVGMREGQHITLLSGPANGDPTGQGGGRVGTIWPHTGPMEKLDWPLETLSPVTVL